MIEPFVPFVTYLIGVAALILAATLLLSRVRPMDYETHRADYVILHVSLGAACGYTGFMILFGNESLTWLKALCVVAAYCQWHMTHETGHTFSAPEIAKRKR
jgi:hypothetical protein